MERHRLVFRGKGIPCRAWKWSGWVGTDGRGGCSSEVERAMHRSSIVATSAWETKSEGCTAEWQKDQKWVASWRRRHGKYLGFPTTSQGYPGLSGRYARGRVWESSQSAGWGSTSRCTEVDHGGSLRSLGSLLGLHARWEALCTHAAERAMSRGCGAAGGRHAKGL